MLSKSGHIRRKDMYTEIGQRCHIVARMLFALILCFSVFSGGRIYGVSFYRLSREGYSSATETLLIVITNDAGNPLNRSWLMMYDEASGSVKRVAIPKNASPCDFAWPPDRAAFVVTHYEGVTFFQKDSSGYGYKPKAIRCPTDALYMCCSCSPNREWLAVNCPDRKSIVHGRLGFYRFNDKKLVRTGLGLDHRQVVWGNDGLLYATNNNSVLAIELKAGKPRVVRTVPLKKKLTIFYGMFCEQPLFQSFDEVRLGDKMLITLDQPAKFRVIATEMVVFVSASPRLLVVFDRSGHEICGYDPGRLIRLGSVKDPNTVYALADSYLVRICVENGSLSLDTVSDLHDASRIKFGEGISCRK